MIIFNKHNLYYTDYTWTDYAPNNPKISGLLDNTKFNRNEGLEVLYLINKMIHLWDFTKIESCTKMEHIIKEKLPTTIITQEETAIWIQINWKSIEFKNNVKKAKV
jgi:hypothetical protein